MDSMEEIEKLVKDGIDNDDGTRYTMDEVWGEIEKKHATRVYSVNL